MEQRIVDGRYRLLGPLGQGGMARVYRAFDIKMGRTVALKVMRPEFARNQGLFNRFVEEARMVARLDNDHIVRVYDWGASSDGSRCYIAMEYVAGQNLRHIMAAHGAFTPRMAADIVRQAADALVAAHGQGIVHSDIKPANIMLDSSGQVKVTDFGVARMRSQQTGRSNGIAGTLLYMSPELMEGYPPDAASDVFALGVTLYELCCGKPPYASMTKPDANMLRRWLSHEPLPSKRVAHVDGRLDGIVATSMRTDPAKRFTTALSLRRALSDYLDLTRDVDEEGLVGPGNPFGWSVSFLIRNGSLGRTQMLSTPMVIGSGDRADFRIESPRIASKQARLAPLGCVLRVDNLGSYETLFVNEQARQHALCVAGDVIRMGGTRLRVGVSKVRQPY